MTLEIKPSTSKTKNFVAGLRNLFAGKDVNTRRPNWVNYAFLAAFVLLLVVTATMSDVFFTQRNLSNLLRQAVTNGLLSLGMLTVILTGGIDLSVGPIVALTGIMVAGFSNQGLPLWLAILICLGVGVGVGAINGLFIARFKLQPFIVTLATLGAIRGLVFVYSDIPITPHDPSFPRYPRIGDDRAFANLRFDHAGKLPPRLVLPESDPFRAGNCCDRRQCRSSAPGRDQCHLEHFPGVYALRFVCSVGRGDPGFPPWDLTTERGGGI